MAKIRSKSDRESCVHYIKLFNMPFCTYGANENNLMDSLRNQPCDIRHKCPLEENEKGETTMNKTNQIVMIPISKLEHHPKNPRKSLGDLSELSESIKSKGVLQNLTVVPIPGADDERYYVVIGNRRLGASRMILDELPCIISDMSEEDQVATMLLENMQRSDLTVFEQAEGFKQLRFEFGKSVEDISAKTGFSESTVRRRLKLSELDHEKLKEVCEDRQITIDDALKVCDIKDEDARNAVLETIGTKNFEYKLSSEMDNQKRKDQIEEILNEVRKFAFTKLDKFPSYGDDVWRFVKSYYTWNDEKPEKPDFDANFAYVVNYNSVSLYADNTPEPEEDEEEARYEAEKNARIAECRAECNSLNDRIYNLRTLFVKNLKIDKPMLVTINKWALKKANDYCSGVDAYIKRASKGLDSGANTKDILSAYELDPYKLAFLLMFGRYADAKTQTYIDREWTGKPEYKDNKTLDEIYDVLTDFGYEISDEEEQLISGTHEIFGKDFLEGIEE